MLKWRSSHITLALSALVLIFISSNLNWYNDNWKDFQEADAKGYYAYLPAVFVYQDLQFGFFDAIEKEKYYLGHPPYEYRKKHGDSYVNKYFSGTALACSPFFLIAHWISPFYGFDQDGYSYLYMVFQTIAALFYCILGLYFLSGLLKLFDCSESTISLVVVSFLFGSNLFYYTVGELGMSHVYSFAFVSWFLNLSKRHIDQNRNRDLLLMAFTFGMIVLIRPVNGLVIFFLPFLAKDLKQFVDWFAKRVEQWKTTLLATVVFFIIVGIQLIIYKFQTGSFFVYSYKGEGFNFLNPEILKFLFSYQKGLFLYTPIYLISLIGLVVLFKDSKYLFYSALLPLCIVIYVLASWWCWFYGGSFSSRVMVEYIPIFAVLLGFALKRFSGYRKTGLVSVLLTVVIVCQIQIFQYRYYEIHWAHMNKEKYWDVFLRVDKLIEKTQNPQKD